MNTQTHRAEQVANSPASDIELRIVDVAERLGLTQRTIRYYEELGLLPPPTRTQGDFRLFSQRDVRRIEEIVRLKNLLGFSLAEIRTVIESEEVRDQLRSEYHATDDVATRVLKLNEAEALTIAQLDLLNRKMSQMLELKADLDARLSRYDQKRRELLSSTEQFVPQVGTGHGVTVRSTL